MTSRTELLALAERVETAEGPDRRVDCLIENALGLAKFERDPRVIFGDADYDRVPPKTYTASIDAAITLVPEGKERWPQIEYISPNPHNKSDGHRVRLWLGGRASVRGKSMASFALALTAAALRAHAEMEEV